MLMLALLLVQAAAAPAPVEPRTFRDWTVACDNGRRCQAIGLHPDALAEQAETPRLLLLERGPEANAAPTFRLLDTDGQPARVLIDGRPVDARVTQLDGGHGIEPRDLATFLTALRSGSRLDVHGANGAALGRVSLSGLSAAMLHMDEAQRRLGTVTALVRTGARPAATVPAPPPLPVIQLAPRTAERPIAISAARIAQLARESGCAAESRGQGSVETDALGGGRTLVLLPCGAGAYNFSSVPYIARRQSGRIVIDPAPFDTPLSSLEREEGRRYLVNAGWDPQERTLGDFSKGRGLGDCGVRSSYGWDGQRFRLVYRETMGECRGSLVYLTTWRADTRR